MNAGMAHTAVLILRFGERVRGRRELNPIPLTAKVAAAIVAFETKRKDLRTFEQAGVHAAVRKVATATTVDTNGSMLKNEGAALVDVAFETGLFILQAVRHHAWPRAHLPGWSIRAMRIVAIRALHEAFIDAMLNGHRKLRPHIGMAAIAEVGLWLGQKLFGRGSLVDRMAVGTDYVGGGVRTAANVCPTKLLRMARQAIVEYLFRSQARKSDNFRLVSLRLCMSFAGAVTTFATLLFELYLLVNKRFSMRIAVKSRPDVRVTGTADGVARISRRQRSFFFLRVCSQANEQRQIEKPRKSFQRNPRLE